MAADLALINPKLRELLAKLLAKCRAEGFEMRPSSGLRGPAEQGKLWRQSRSSEEIAAKITEFRAKGANFLADCIENVGPQHGDHVTDAPPGFSWHQWGEAVDCFWLLDGKAEWSTTRLVNGRNAYKVYTNEAAALGLTAGGNWKTFKDWPHVQLRADRNPETKLGIAEIDKEMKARFGT